MQMLQLYNCLSLRHLNLLSRLGALTGGLESASISRGSETDSRGSNWTKLDSTADPTWVEPRHEADPPSPPQTPRESGAAPS